MPAKFASTSQQINRSKRPLEWFVQHQSFIVLSHITEIYMLNSEEIPLNLPFSSLCTEQPEGPKRRKLYVKCSASQHC
jgi:hypothetical protein